MNNLEAKPSTLEAKATFKEGLAFDVELGGHTIRVDAPEQFGGQNSGPKPTYFILASMMTCTGMDVVNLLRKQRVEFTSFSLSCETEIDDTTPKTFTRGRIFYHLEGTFSEKDLEKIRQSVKASKTKYCIVSISLEKSFPIDSVILVNGKEI